jgi:hypothetical protein
MGGVAQRSRCRCWWRSGVGDQLGRGENQALRAHVAGLEAEKAALAQKVELARERLESLMARLPEE